jgi:hypothetical protein
MQFAFGSGLLWGLRTDVANATPVRFGALQDVTIDFDGEQKELFSQYTFPIDTARGKTKIVGKAKLAQISAVQFSNLFFGTTPTVGQTLIANDEVGTPVATSYTAANGTNFLFDLGVRYQSTGFPLNLVAVAPTVVGTYQVATGGVYTFFSGDSGKPMLFDYAYSSTTGGQTILVQNQLMGFSPRFQAIFTEKYENNTMTLVLYACASTKLGFASKLDDYMIPELDFTAYATGGGQVYQFSTSQ